MHIIHMSLNKRKGIATIFIVLILIGVLFTAHIPLMLVKQESDNWFEKSIHLLENESSEKNREFLRIYPIPSTSADIISVTIINECELTVTVTALWINDTYKLVHLDIPPMSNVVLGPFPLKPKEGGEYDVKVTTLRGNEFNSYIGTIVYQGGKWINGAVGFRLIFPSKNKCSKMNPMKISILEAGDYVYRDEVVYWCISASEVFFDLGEGGEYNLVITAGGNVIFNDIRTLNWPMGSAVEEFEFIIDGQVLSLG